MHKKANLIDLNERIEDVKLVYEHCIDSGRETIKDLSPPIKYLLADLVEVFNDGIRSNGMFNANKASFFSVIKPFVSNQPTATNDFDAGVDWLIDRLNSSNLSSFLQIITVNQNYFDEKYSKYSIIISKRDEFRELLRKLESSVKFSIRRHQVAAASESKDTDVEVDDIDGFITIDPLQFDAIPCRALPGPSRMLRFSVKAHAIKEMMSKFSNLNTKNSPPLPIGSDVDKDDRYEDVSIPLKGETEQTSESTLAKMAICPEVGLAEQNYSCPQCGNGISLKDSLKCDFSGKYFCTSCHGGEKLMNPVRIMRNWDFQKYPISRSSRNQIVQLSYKELLDFPSLNSTQFKSLSDFKHIHAIREKIVNMAKKRLKAVGSQQKAQQQQKLEKFAWPKLHLLKSTRLYTIEDLIEIQRGFFYSQTLLPLYNVLKF